MHDHYINEHIYLNIQKDIYKSAQILPPITIISKNALFIYIE